MGTSVLACRRLTVIVMRRAVAIGTATAAAVTPTTSRAVQGGDGPIGASAYDEENYDGGQVHFRRLKNRKQEVCEESNKPSDDTLQDYNIQCPFASQFATHGSDGCDTRRVEQAEDKEDEG